MRNPAIILEHVIQYSRNGWHLFPVHHVENGQCSCGDGDCSRPGKHPIVDRVLGLTNGFHSASNDELILTGWWQYYPNANIGAATGISGWDVLDIDLRNDGLDSWRNLIDLHGSLPDTIPTVRTPGGGRHLFFPHDDRVTTSRGQLPPGIDVRGTGGYVLLPPSQNDGRSYEWSLPITPPYITEWPAWLLDLITGEARESRRRASPRGVPGRIGHGERNVVLFSLAGSARRRGVSEDGIYALIAQVNEERCDPPLDDAEVRRIARSAARYELPEEELQFTDLANARNILNRFGNDIHYCWPWKEWIIWSGKRWVQDQTGEIFRIAVQATRLSGAEAEAIEDDELRNRVTTHARRSESWAKIKAMTELVRSEPDVAIMPQEIDTDPYTLNVQNGQLNLRNGECREHSREPILMRIADSVYDPSATCPKWDRFMHEVFAGDSELTAYVQRCLGYCLTGSVSEDAMWILWGTGANGKSTFVEVIRTILGPYASMTSPDLLMERRSEMHPTGLADLHGRRVVFSVETQFGKYMNESLLKQLTGGDPINARRMFENFWEFQPTHKLWLITNHKPKVRDTGSALWRRIRVIPFRISFPPERQNKLLPEQLMEEAPGILRWMVEGCVRWMQEGLREPESVIEATEDYRREQDILGAWIASQCVVGTEFREELKLLYDSFRDWYQAGGFTNIPSIHSFGLQLSDRGYSRARDDEKRLTSKRQGLKLRESGSSSR